MATVDFFLDAVTQDEDKDVTDKKKKSSVSLFAAEEMAMTNVYEITESSSDESVSETLSSGTRDKTVVENLDAKAAVIAEDQAVEEGEKELEIVEKTHARVCTPEPEEQLYKTKNVADMQYLFTNDKLKDESPAMVLKSDPFCIPRVTDNVPNYRPMLNPLSIFLGEDQLLPGNFRLDPLERPPKASEKVVKQEGTNIGPNGILPPPRSSSSTLSTGKQFRGKTSAFMGTMPRQTEFAEIPVPEKLFQNHELFRPLPPISRVPTSPQRDDRRTLMKRKSGNKLFTSSSSDGEQQSISLTTDMVATPASLSDAMLLSSIQHTLDVTTTALTATSGSMPSLSDEGPTCQIQPLYEGGPTCQIQPLQPLDTVVDTLANYLPSRSSSRLDSSRPVDEQQFDPSGGNNPMSYAVGVSGAFGSLLSAVEHQTSSSPYAGLFIDSGAAESTNLTMQTFSSALGSIFITTPTHTAAGINAGLITPQGRSSKVTIRRPGARKPRAKNVFRPCTSSGCTKGARGKSGLCQKHGGGKRCAAPNCPKGAQGSSAMCLFHGGGYRCTVEGCTTGARGTSGLCAKHGGYKKGKASSTGKREPNVGVAVKRIRTDHSQQSPALVNAE
ncbi:hypothetical protein KXD40_000505 [Peronospora effusa]|uniref:Uncharacterized protein n=1 Tax=Peronospora effusa TaxID=542832 RepID=A0A3M6VJ06_9STRA|nr:hypothetical protein DD238_002568 [Peronospora effusa]RQM14406.1 hypothetical protein DD237_004682 [Peronospora effusa]UIZ20434.1 hypothetical protein KXD40_000505 [Peronospora effusa]CAI5702135.1 unnamed protein product [Peronospora effusa]